MDERSVVSEDDEQDTKESEQIERKNKESYAFVLRVVVPHAFIKPPRPNYDEMSIENLEDRLKQININIEDLPKFEDKDDRKKQLKDVLTTREESAILQKNTKIVVAMLLKYKEDDKVEELTCDIPLKQTAFTRQNNYMNLGGNKDPWEKYGTDVLPARSEFGLIHFPSGYRFDFRNIREEDVDKIEYLEIRLKDFDSENRLAISKIKKVKVKNKSIRLKKWLKSWFKSGNKTEHICFSEKAQPYDPLAPPKKKKGSEKKKEDDEISDVEDDKEETNDGEDNKEETGDGEDNKEETNQFDGDSKKEFSHSGEDTGISEDNMEESSDEELEHESYDTWMKVNLFLFSMDDEKELHVPNCSENRKKNEYPVMPNEEEIKLIKIRNIKPLKLMFFRFQTVSMRDEIIEFAISRCHYSIFNHVLALCLLRSNDPLKTALEASQLCEKRTEQVNGDTEHWEQKSEACLKIAIRLGDTIPKLQEKLQDTQYYVAAAEHILDQNLVFAVESEMIEVLHSNVFSDRTYKRWMNRRMTIFPFFPQISPCISFLGQALLFLTFCILFTYIASTSYQIYNLNWTSGFDNTMFGIEGVDTNTFWDIYDSDSFYTWMENMLVPQIFSDTANYSSSPSSLYWYLITPSVVVRQIRVKPQNCSYLPYLTCYEDLFDVSSGAVEDRDPQYAGYNYYPDLGGLNLLGLSPTTRYHAGGYAVFLEGTTTDVLGQIEEMKNKSFIDPATRAIIIEFAIFSPNSGLFMMFEILVEFTHISVVYTNRAMVVQQPLSDGLLEKQPLTLFFILTAFIIGYILQEMAEMAVMCKSRIKELERKDEQEAEEDDNKKNEEKVACCTSCVDQMKVIGGDPFSRIVSATLHTFTNHYLSDVWNILDFFINSTVVIFLVLVYVQYFAFNFIPDSDTQYVEIHNLWISEIIIETANITASIGLIMAWLRVLYFTLPVRTVGPLVIGMLRMYQDVLYFIFLMTVFLLGFTTAFDVIFSGTFDIYTGYGIAGFNTVRLSLGNVNYADSSIFLQLPLKWFGNTMIIVYILISSIILVNLLISMMGGTYNTLQETIEAKWRHLFGDLLLHYERFVLMPPPFNIPHVMFYFLVTGFPRASKIFISESKWELVGNWKHDEEWKLNYRKVLHRDHLYNQPGPFSTYSTSYWEQIVLDEIEEEINTSLQTNHRKVIKHIKRLWVKGIKKRLFEKEFGKKKKEKLGKLKKEIRAKINNIPDDDLDNENTDDDDLDVTDEPGDDEIEDNDDIVEATVKNVEESTWKMWFEEREKALKKKEIRKKSEMESKGATKKIENKYLKKKANDEELKDFWINRMDEDSSSLIDDSA